MIMTVPADEQKETLHTARRFLHDPLNRRNRSGVSAAHDRVADLPARGSKTSSHVVSGPFRVVVRESRSRFWESKQEVTRATIRGALAELLDRSEERRVGKEAGGCGSRVAV